MSYLKRELANAAIVGGAKDEAWVRAGDIARWVLRGGEELRGAFRCCFFVVDVRDGEVEG